MDFIKDIPLIVRKSLLFFNNLSFDVGYEKISFMAGNSN